MRKYEYIIFFEASHEKWAKSSSLLTPLPALVLSRALHAAVTNGSREDYLFSIKSILRQHSDQQHHPAQLYKQLYSSVSRVKANFRWFWESPTRTYFISVRALCTLRSKLHPSKFPLSLFLLQFPLLYFTFTFSSHLWHIPVFGPYCQTGFMESRWAEHCFSPPTNYSLPNQPCLLP